jgi:hypothetical protein
MKQTKTSETDDTMFAEGIWLDYSSGDKEKEEK